MTVKELVEKLASLDPTLDVICYTEDESLQSPGKAFVLFDIESVDTTDAERVRLDNNTPYLKFGRSQHSVKLALLSVTSDF